jgi:hypothetical protein
MAEQITDKIFVSKGYIDDSMSIDTIESLLSLPRGRKFVGLTITVLKAITTENGSIPADFWLSENTGNWELKSIPSLDKIEDIDVIPSDLIPIGFEVRLKNGNKYNFKGVDEENKYIWEASVSRKEFDETIADVVSQAIDEVTSGASEAFDTLKEIEDWIKANTGNTGSLDEEQIANIIESAKSYTDQKISELEIPSTEGLATSGDVENIKTWVKDQDYLKEHQDISHLAVSADVVSAIEEIRDSIPSIEGLATSGDVENVKTWVNEQGFITEHQDLSDYAKKSEIPSLEGYATSGDVKNAIDLHITMYHTPSETGGTIDPVIPQPTLKYTEGSGITIDENKISVKIAKDTEEKENFIEINENNELELNEITLDAAVISEDIEVNGGAWADEIETVFNGKIPRGITFEDFLKKMVKKEKYAGEISTDRNFEVFLTNNNPTLTSNGMDVIGQVVEIGTMVKLGAISAPETKAVQTLSAGPFTYGYKVGKDGEYKNSQLYTEALTPNLVESESKIHVTFSNLVNDINGNTELEGIFVSGGNSVNEVVGYVREGHNNIRISQTGNTYSSNSDVKGNSIFVASSLKNYTNSNGETNIYEITFPSSAKTAMSQVDYQVTGAKKYYIGGINEYSKDYWAKTKGNRSDVIRNLELQGWASDTSIEVSYEFKKGTKQQIVAAPIEYNTVIGTDRIGGPVNFEKVAENINFYNQQGYVSKYNVFVAPAYDGLVANSFINILIEK